MPVMSRRAMFYMVHFNRPTETIQSLRSKGSRWNRWERPYGIEPGGQEPSSRSSNKDFLVGTDIVILDALWESFTRSSHEACSSELAQLRNMTKKRVGMFDTLWCTSTILEAFHTRMRRSTRLTSRQHLWETGQQPLFHTPVVGSNPTLATSRELPTPEGILEQSPGTLGSPSPASGLPSLGYLSP